MYVTKTNTWLAMTLLILLGFIYDGNNLILEALRKKMSKIKTLEGSSAFLTRGTLKGLMKNLTIEDFPFIDFHIEPLIGSKND